MSLNLKCDIFRVANLFGQGCEFNNVHIVNMCVCSCTFNCTRPILGCEGIWLVIWAHLVVWYSGKIECSRFILRYCGTLTIICLTLKHSSVLSVLIPQFRTHLCHNSRWWAATVAWKYSIEEGFLPCGWTRIVKTFRCVQKRSLAPPCS